MFCLLNKQFHLLILARGMFAPSLRRADSPVFSNKTNRRDSISPYSRCLGKRAFLDISPPFQARFLNTLDGVNKLAGQQAAPFIILVFHFDSAIWQIEAARLDAHKLTHGP